MKSCLYSSPDINCNDYMEGVGQEKLHKRKMETKHKNVGILQGKKLFVKSRRL
jgi:hypothetical protein